MKFGDPDQGRGEYELAAGYHHQLDQKVDRSIIQIEKPHHPVVANIGVGGASEGEPAAIHEKSSVDPVGEGRVGSTTCNTKPESP